MLYMFQVVPLPIIRGSKLYTQHRVFVELLLLTAIVSKLDSGKKQNTLTMHGPMNVKKHTKHFYITKLSTKCLCGCKVCPDVCDELCLMRPFITELENIIPFLISKIARPLRK